MVVQLHKDENERKRKQRAEHVCSLTSRENDQKKEKEKDSN